MPIAPEKMRLICSIAAWCVATLTNCVALQLGQSRHPRPEFVSRTIAPLTTIATRSTRFAVVSRRNAPADMRGTRIGSSVGRGVSSSMHRAPELDLIDAGRYELGEWSVRDRSRWLIPMHFFDEFPRFVETSETGPWLHRLNARYAALIDANRDLIRGRSCARSGEPRRPLQLRRAPHGRRVTSWASSTIRGSCRRPRRTLRSTACRARDYEFVAGDMFDRIRYSRAVRRSCSASGSCTTSTTTCGCSPSWPSSTRERSSSTPTSRSRRGAVVELRSPLAGSPPPHGSQTRRVAEPVPRSRRCGRASAGRSSTSTGRARAWPIIPKLADYAAGRRLTAVVVLRRRPTSHPEVRASAGARGARTPARPAHAVADDHRRRVAVRRDTAGVAHLGAAGRARPRRRAARRRLTLRPGWRCGRLTP